jgi:pilus assembly protein TadC
MTGPATLALVAAPLLAGCAIWLLRGSRPVPSPRRGRLPDARSSPLRESRFRPWSGRGPRSRGAGRPANAATFVSPLGERARPPKAVPISPAFIAFITAALGAAVAMAALGAGWFGFAIPVVVGLSPARTWLRARRAARSRRAAQAAVAPAVVDLLAACLSAGLNGHLALLRVAERCPIALRDELRLVAADLGVGQSPAVALRAAAERTGLAELRAAAGALHAAERWGAPPAEALAARAEALRSRLHQEAEAAAGRAAVRLTFPLVLCFLPAFVLLTVVPMVASALRALDL